VPELQAGTNGAITLTMVNQSPKVLFETVGKYAGMNVLFDPEYQPGKNFSLTLDSVTPTQALDHLALLSKSFWKALSQNTVFVTNDNPNKRRDYEAQVTRVFYLSNVNTPQEMQEIINTVRSMADLQRVMPYSTQYAIIARGEADKITLAAALIADLDKPRSEVVVDILVLEASQVFSRKITAALASTGLSLPVNFSPRASIQTPHHHIDSHHFHHDHQHHLYDSLHHSALLARAPCQRRFLRFATRRPAPSRDERCRHARPPGAPTARRR
jgi:general secretion pathway protein D